MTLLRAGVFMLFTCLAFCLSGPDEHVAHPGRITSPWYWTVLRNWFAVRGGYSLPGEISGCISAATRNRNSQPPSGVY